MIAGGGRLHAFVLLDVAEDTRRTLEVRVLGECAPRVCGRVRRKLARRSRCAGGPGQCSRCSCILFCKELLVVLMENMMKLESLRCGVRGLLVSVAARAMTRPMPRVDACAMRGLVLSR